LERVLVEERAHASDLLPAVDELVRELGSEPRATTLVVVGTGPGSYTGLRVAIASALGICRAAHAQALGIPSGEALCWELGAEGELLTIVLDARSQGVTLASYRRVLQAGVTEIAVVQAPQWLPIAEARAHVALEGRVLVDATVPDLCGFEPALRARCSTVRPPRAAALLELGIARAARGQHTPLAELQPLYLRDFVPTTRKR
jgi:N6-L-threonylcarbamoyladenine synthase